jgi:hypothetical protein
MLICFNATVEAKNALDTILATRQFCDISEAVSMALVNYQLLQQTVPQGGHIFPAAVPTPGTDSPATDRAPANRLTGQATFSRPTIIARTVVLEIPEVFALKAKTADGMSLLATPSVSDTGAAILPPARWLFGQFNKFLPVKASCRALFNLLLENPAGIPVAEAANKISHAACGLGDYLKALDDRLQARREDAFAAAFPSSTIEGGGESRLRFGNQFVANMRQNQLGGFPAALKFVAIETAKEPRLSVTKAGADFALLQNPILDAPGTPVTRKLTVEETEFLLAHIIRSVPEEISAYASILDAIQSGANTPDAVDKSLRQRFNLPTEQAITKTFLTTQRTGAISRLVDLGLVAREKEGLRVTYIIAQPGKDFRAQIKS